MAWRRAGGGGERRWTPRSRGLPGSQLRSSRGGAGGDRPVVGDDAQGGEAAGDVVVDDTDGRPCIAWRVAGGGAASGGEKGEGEAGEGAVAVQVVGVSGGVVREQTAVDRRLVR